MSRRDVRSEGAKSAQVPETRTLLPFTDDEGGSLCPVPEELAVLAEFAAGAGHEINNPLATILGRVELVVRRLPELPDSGLAAEIHRDLRLIAGQAQRIRDMIGDLMLFARPPQPRLEIVDLRELVWQAVAPFRTLAAERSVTLELAAPEVPAMILADSTQVKVVAAELLRNAFEAFDSTGVISVRIEIADDQHIGFAVEDSGRGLTSYERQHLFHPFYSGRNAGRGLGFGLCKCWRIVTEHGGGIEVRPRPEGGTLVQVTWPRATADSRAELNP